MLTREENEVLVRTNAGTPMGDLLRRYWIPALMSTELPEPDCPPVRVQLMGEKLIAFRDTENKIGLLDEFCAHRRTSLWLGRNEECGLRCVFHGWKYDVDGNCVDMMNEPPESKFKDEVKLTAYPTTEMGGVVWAYMGPKDKMPVLPKFEWTQVPESHRGVSKNWQQCNWLQALEAGVDTAHVPVLHRLLNTDSEHVGYAPSTEFGSSGPAKVEVDVTDFGYRYAGIRPLGEKGNFVRTYQWVLPFHQIRPEELGSYRGGGSRPFIAGHMWVPMDDENCMVYNWAYSFDGPPLTAEWEQLEKDCGRGPGDVMPNFMNIRNKQNDWLIDRQVQKTEIFTGITGLNNQDQAAQEAMGPIVDRTKENLSASDMAIVSMRKILQQALSTVADGGDPPGLGDSYYKARAVDRVLPEGVNWLDALMDEIQPK